MSCGRGQTGTGIRAIKETGDPTFTTGSLYLRVGARLLKDSVEIEKENKAFYCIWHNRV